VTVALDPRWRREGRRLQLLAGIAIIGLVAALTHLSAILLIPRVATQDAYNVLAAKSPPNTLIVLPPSRPGDKAVPYRDPATIQALCFFDVGKAPIRVRTHVEEGKLLTLSFRTPQGRVFYSMTDRAALKDVIDIRLVTSAQLNAIEDAETDVEQGLPSELRLKVPSQRGLLVATTLVERPSEREAAEARIRAITCAPEPLPPRS
jgi:uncharacterized membrane protein